MSYTNGLDDPSAYFQTALFTGNAGTNAITNTGNSDLQPDWVWFKCRSATEHHGLFDSVRGVTKAVYSNLANAEDTLSDSLASFNSDGFTMGADTGSGGAFNGSGKTMAAWQWKAGTSFSNSAGANGADLASAGSYNRDAGFSIVTWTGNATDDQQIYHGLNAVPQMMILKNRTNSNNESWKVYHQAIGNTHALTLDTTAAKSDNVEWWSDETPTSTVFTVGRQDATNNNSMIAYCFAPKQGYSKFGSYTGSSANTFVYLGFKPKFFLWKNISQGSSTYDHWGMVDSERQTPSGNTDGYLRANANNEESDFSGNGLFFLSNGIKFINTGRYNDNTGDTYIYMAFAENPFVTSSGVPVTAG